MAIISFDESSTYILFLFKFFFIHSGIFQLI